MSREPRFTTHTLALLGCLGLAACADSPALFNTGPGPNRPTTDSFTMRRVAGLDEPPEPLRPEAGNIWPGAADTARRSVFEPDPNPNPANPPPAPRRGSSSPPPRASEGPQPGVAPFSDFTDPRRPAAAAPPPRLEGTVIQTGQGPAVVTGGGRAGQTVIMPDGTTGIVAPGAGTVLRSDGTVVPIAR